MAFTRLTDDLNTIEQLADKPNKQSGITAAQLKAFFDENAQTIKEYINDTLLAEIEDNGATSGYSGAKNVGIASRTEFSTYTNVEDVLLYFRELIRQAVAGELGDNDVKTNMLDHTSTSRAVDTGAIRDEAVTNDKLATISTDYEGITNNKIKELDASKLTGTIDNARLSAIPAAKLAGGILASQLAGEIPADKLAGEIPFSKTTGTLPIDRGGTNATTAATARANLSVTEAGKVKIGDTEYTLTTASSGTGTAEYITFII